MNLRLLIRCFLLMVSGEVVPPYPPELLKTSIRRGALTIFSYVLRYSCDWLTTLCIRIVFIARAISRWPEPGYNAVRSRLGLARNSGQRPQPVGSARRKPVGDVGLVGSRRVRSVVTSVAPRTTEPHPWPILTGHGDATDPSRRPECRSGGQNVKMEELSERESEVLGLVAGGLTNAQISAAADHLRSHGGEPRRISIAQAGPGGPSCAGRVCDGV